MSGRHYLVTYNGATFQEPRPSYLQTAEEADDTMRHLRAIYGGDYGIVDANVAPTCTANHPHNGSHCERPYGHKGRCHYTESLDGKRRTWIRADLAEQAAFTEHFPHLCKPDTTRSG